MVLVFQGQAVSCPPPRHQEIGMLSRQQIEHYRESGWLVVEDMLDAPLLAQARGVIADFVAKAERVSAHDEVYDLEPGHRPEAPRVRRIKTPHKNHPYFNELARSSGLVAALQALLGDAVRLHG